MSIAKYESYRRLRCCAPSPALAGEGWGGGKPQTPLPEASTFEASVDEAGGQVGSPRVAPPPQPSPAKSGRGSERTTLVAGNDRFQGLDTVARRGRSGPRRSARFFLTLPLSARGQRTACSGSFLPGSVSLL